MIGNCSSSSDLAKKPTKLDDEAELSSIRLKMNFLKKMYSEGLLSEDEYLKKRKELLDKF